MALIDCSEAFGSELFVVEGLSAANALSSVRDRLSQAVLPMQGKIPNANRTSLDKLLQHEQVGNLMHSLHPDGQVEAQLTQFRFERVILLSDPDADGLHAGLLLILFLSTQVPALVEQGRLFFKGIASLDVNQRRSLMAKDNPVRHQLTKAECEQLCQSIVK